MVSSARRGVIFAADGTARRACGTLSAKARFPNRLRSDRQDAAIGQPLRSMHVAPSAPSLRRIRTQDWRCRAPDRDGLIGAAAQGHAAMVYEGVAMRQDLCHSGSGDRAAQRRPAVAAPAGSSAGWPLPALDADRRAALPRAAARFPSAAGRSRTSVRSCCRKPAVSRSRAGRSERADPGVCVAPAATSSANAFADASGQRLRPTAHPDARGRPSESRVPGDAAWAANGRGERRGARPWARCSVRRAEARRERQAASAVGHA